MFAVLSMVCLLSQDSLLSTNRAFFGIDVYNRRMNR